jgi:hypothetical protein
MTKEDQSRFFAMSYNDVRCSDAWKHLDHGARSLFLELKARYNRSTEGPVYLSSRDAVELLGKHSNRRLVLRWFRELQYYRFIVMITPGHLGVEGRGKAPGFRLTDEKYLGKPPTLDFLKWDGEPYHEQKPPSHYKRMDFIRRKGKQKPGADGCTTLVQMDAPPLVQMGVPVRKKLNKKPGADGGTIFISSSHLESRRAVDPDEGHPDCVLGSS